MDLLRALGALAYTLESEHTLAQSLVFLESSLAQTLGAERVTIAFGGSRPNACDARDIVAPLVLDARSIGVVTVRFANPPTQRERESVRVLASPLAALVAWRSQTSERGRLHDLVRTDALTGLANRMAFDERLDAAWKRATEHRASLSVALLDVDLFKLYNDRYGHVEGDACLRAVAKLLSRESERAGAFVARYGGEEFAIVFEDVSHEEAFFAMERLARAFESEPLAHAGSALGRISISAGIASADAAAPLEIAALVRDADRSLYRAKSLGRNRICAGSYVSHGAVVTREARAIAGPPGFDDATVGRSADVARVVAALRQSPLVTLAGGAGIGKSRLACIAGAAVHDTMTGGVAYVDFSSFSSDSDPAALVATAFDLEIDANDLRNGLCEALRARNALLILDNIALANARTVAALCDELLSSSRSLGILATSRAPLGSAGERTIVVSALDDIAAVELMRMRSNVSDLPRLRALARGLDGNARALETAARELRRAVC